VKGLVERQIKAIRDVRRFRRRREVVEHNLTGYMRLSGRMSAFVSHGNRSDHERILEIFVARQLRRTELSNRTCFFQLSRCIGARTIAGGDHNFVEELKTSSRERTS